MTIQNSSRFDYLKERIDLLTAKVTNLELQVVALCAQMEAVLAEEGWSGDQTTAITGAATEEEPETTIDDWSGNV